MEAANRKQLVALNSGILFNQEYFAKALDINI